MQIFGSDVDRFVEAALKCEALGASIVDINMGCSVNCVSSRGAGAGLLREPKKIGAIFKRISRAVKIPVTGKIRLGWDDDILNYLDVARTIEDNGGSARWPSMAAPKPSSTRARRAGRRSPKSNAR